MVLSGIYALQSTTVWYKDLVIFCRRILALLLSCFLSFSVQPTLLSLRLNNRNVFMLLQRGC